MARGRYDDDDLDDEAPWLAEGVREKPRGSTMVPRGRIIGGGLIALALVVLIGLGVYLISARKQDGSGGFKRAEDAPIIAADTGPYKLAPTDPGGAAVAGVDDSIAATTQGADTGSAIDTTAVPEEPLARPSATVPEPPTDLLPATPQTAPVAKAPAVAPPPVKIAPAPVVPVKVAPVAVSSPVKVAPAAKPVDALVKPTAKPVTPPIVKAVAVPSGGSASLQLGAFSTEAKADAAWVTAVGHAPALAALSKRIEPIDRDGKTLYRLRAGGVASKAAATDLCARVKAGGDACLVAE